MNPVLWAIAQLNAEIEAIENAFDHVRSAVLAQTHELKERDRRTHDLLPEGFTQASADVRRASAFSHLEQAAHRAPR